MNITKQTTEDDMIEFNPLIMENKLFKLCAEVNRAEAEHAKLDEQFDILHDMKEEFLSAIMDDQDAATNVEARRMALKTLKWKEFMLGYQQARNKARQAKVAKSVAERNWRTCQSILSSVRQTKMGGV